MQTPDMSHRSRGVRRIGALLLVTVGAYMGEPSRASACESLPDQVLHPAAGERDVPTNANILVRTSTPSSTPSPTMALRRVLGATSEDGGAPAGADGGLNVYRDSEYTPLTQRCRTQNGYTLCAGSAELQPRSRYAVWTNDPAFTSKPLTFFTGDGPRTPRQLPELDAKVVQEVSPFDGGSCGSLPAITVTLGVEETDEPWLLIPRTGTDGPMLIRANQRTFVWSTSSPPDCFRLDLMNWAGERSEADVLVCLRPPAPWDAGAPDAGSGSEDAGFSSLPEDASTPSSDASAERSDAGVGSPQQPDAGCGCRINSTARGLRSSWVGAVLAGWFAVRRLRRRAA